MAVWEYLRDFLLTDTVSLLSLCLTMRPDLLWAHVGADFVTAFAYLSIPASLLYYARKRQESVRFHWLLRLFATFIALCGVTHILHILTLWVPIFGFATLFNGIAAAVSIVVAGLLWYKMPELISMPTREEMRAAQEARAHSEERFRLLVHSVKDYAICMLDTQGNVANWNAGAERSKGYTESEIVGEHFSKFYPQEDRDAGLPTIALCTAAAEGRYSHEGWRVRKDGAMFWADVVIDPIHDDTGTLIGFAKITRDVTERRAALAALEENRLVIAQAQKMEALGHVAGGIAHDFNNILAAIILNLDRAQRYLDGSNKRLVKAVESALKAAEKGSGLTNHMLAFARKQPDQDQTFDVNSVLRDFCSLLGDAVGEGRHIELDLADEELTLVADRSQFETAMINLAINARDAMQQGGEIRIITRARRDKGQRVIVVEVCDQGVGMPPEVLNRAFEPFFTTKAVGQGTGLGLAQVFGFTKQSGGIVEIDSEVSRGTRVRMTFPARREASLAA